MPQNNILHLDSEFGWRGGQQQAVYLFEGLLKRDYKTKFVCQKNSKLSKYFISKKLPFLGIRMRGEIDIFAAFKIASLCKKENYTIIHAHSAHALSIGIIAKLFYPKTKIIGARRVDFHLKNNPFSRFKYRTKLVSKIVCISNGIKNVMLEDGISKNKLRVIHSGINIHKFDKIEKMPDFRKKYKIKENDIIIGTIAALVGHKDYPNLLKAAEIVLSKKNNVIFISLGDGKNEREIKNLATNLELKNKFLFLGYKSNVGEIIKNFDIFVMASKKEGLGTSILDAQSIGLPVIGTQTGGIPEAVHHNENGLLVPPRNHKELASAIIKLIDDEKLREEFSQNANESVKKFDIELTITKNIALYDEILK
jgi:glycosyltransferase involved in cell wall biosynthesis